VISQIANTLEKWYPLLMRAFTYYSVIGADVNNNINGIPAPGYTALILDGKLDITEPDVDGGTARFARSRGGDGWDLIWVSVNTSKESISQAAYNSPIRFTRGEFLEFIVRACVQENTPQEKMASNVRTFCQELVGYLALSPDAEKILHDADAFRREHCYPRETDAMLKHHDETLRSVFAVYAEKGAGGIEVDGSIDLMSCAQWMALMRDVDFSKECGVRNLYLIFAHSRMCVISESKKSPQITQLTYEGFLEAIVRLSLLKALPTDKEMKKKCFTYPSEYIGAIMNRGMVMYESWVLAAKRHNAAGKGDPVYRRVDTLVLLLVGIMQYGVEQQPGGPTVLLRGHPDEILSLEEVKRYWKKPTRTVFEESSGTVGA